METDTNNQYAMLSDPEMQEIIESFIVESNEIFERLDTDLIELENHSDDEELLNQIFRAFHTIKGTSGFLGLEKLTKVTHKCEDILNKLRKSEIKLSSELMDVILLSLDTIKELVEVIERDKNEGVDIESTLDSLSTFLQNIELGKIEDSTSEKEPEGKSAPENEKKETEPKKIPKNSKAAKKHARTKKEKSTEKVEVKADAEQDKEVKPDVETKSTKSNKDNKERSEEKYLNKGKAKKEDINIRVEVERLDELLNIVSELVLGRNQLVQVNSKAALEHEGTNLSKDLAVATKQIDLMTNELQLVVMKTRMVKIGKVFNRFPRLVRDLSREINKNVCLTIKGEETELDKTLIEEINDPLVHLVRNSIDHGIESPEDRKKNGKAEQGNLILAAHHEGNNVIISVEDDGKGINPEVIKKKAIEKGLITEQKAEEMPLQDVYSLIFLPGFSTAAVVTNVSGRGVGMDVVRTNVSRLRGIIKVESTPGKGTKMIIKLPLTLAIIPGMVVQLVQDPVIIPLSSVLEVLRVHTEDIYTVNNNEVIKSRDRVLPLIDIDEHLFGNKPADEEKVFQFVVVVGVAEKEYGIKVDSMIGQQEVVIKPLGDYLKKVDGIAGSTILGDGRVVIILDIAEIVNEKCG